MGFIFFHRSNGTVFSRVRDSSRMVLPGALRGSIRGTWVRLLLAQNVSSRSVITPTICSPIRAFNGAVSGVLGVVLVASGLVYP